MCARETYRLIIYVFLLKLVNCVHIPRCEKIISPICQNLGYNMTMMPNFAGHGSQQEAAKGLQTFQPLLHYNCSAHLRLFVCSVFTPLCSEHVPGAVPACRALCETVRADCQPVLDRFLLPWPAELDCGRFPEPPALCMRHPEGDNHHLREESVLGGQNENVTTGGILEFNLGAFSICPPRFISIEESCTPICGQDAYYRSEDKQYTKNWTLIWSVLSTIFTAITLLTFWINQNRFRYPERPLLFMTSCCFIYSTLILFRTILGPNFVTCFNGYLVTKSSENILCAATAFLLQHLEFAARMWWLVFLLSWYLHARLEWSNESLVGLSSLFHAAVIGCAGLPALLALGTGRIGSDELTGACGIKEESSIWFIVIPQSFILILGLIFGLFSMGALLKVAKTVRNGRHSTRLRRLTARILAVLILYSLPEVAHLTATSLEAWQRPWWKSLALLSALDCRGCSQEPLYHSAGLTPVLIRQAATHLIGICCLLWVCSGKTCKIWINVLNSPKKMSPITKV